MPSSKALSLPDNAPNRAGLASEPELSGHPDDPHSTRIRDGILVCCLVLLSLTTYLRRIGTVFGKLART
jgi:hypothetical protein